MGDEVREVDAGRISDVGAAHRVAYAEKTLREVDAAVKSENENKVPNPVPAIFEALDKGQKVDEGGGMGNRKREVYYFAEKVNKIINAEEVLDNDPKQVVAEKLISSRKLEDRLLISGTSKDGRSAFVGDLMVQNISPLLRSFGAISGNAPDQFPHGQENSFLARLLRKDGCEELKGKESSGSGELETTTFIKDTKIPGVKIGVVVYKTDIDSQAGFNQFGFPIIRRLELIFSPQALANMEPGSKDEVLK